MSFVRANGLHLAYQEWGSSEHPPVVLIMGLGGQLVSWPQDLINRLVKAGYRVLAYDNRDVGLSSKLDHLGQPQLPRLFLRQQLGLGVRPPYTLDDMAMDACGFLDAMNLESAHIVGISMGGMIAQILAGREPARLRSLSLLMTSSGHRRLPGPSLRLRLRMARRRSRDPEQSILDSIETHRRIGSPAYPEPEEHLRSRLRRQLDRCVHPAGISRQLAAIIAAPSRRKLLSQIETPSLILHGLDDPLVPVAAAHDLQQCLPHARCELIAGMGHDLPPQLIGRISDELIRHFRQS